MQCAHEQSSTLVLKSFGSELWVPHKEAYFLREIHSLAMM